MRIGIIGLGRMGSGIARRLMQAGHETVVWDRDAATVAALVPDGAGAATSLADLAEQLGNYAVYWVMLPAGGPTETTVEALAHLAGPGAIVIDGGNSFYKDGIRRSKSLAERGIDFIDVGTSGGVWGLERGFCMMIGGRDEIVHRLDPIFAALAPGIGNIARTAGRDGRDDRAERGYIHAGPAGAGHFVKMVHNGIEYGMMQAYAEGFAILNEKKEFDLDLHQISRIWQTGSVVRSWLLDLTADIMGQDEDLTGIENLIAGSGLATAIGLASVMDEIGGTFVVMGTPAEEGGAQPAISSPWPDTMGVTSATPGVRVFTDDTDELDAIVAATEALLTAARESTVVGVARMEGP